MIWNNISVKIRTAVLLQGIHLQIQKGDVLGIIGPNGSGKTVLAKAIAGDLPVNGEVAEKAGFLNKRFVPFHSSLTLSNGHAVYRQQRWNKIDTELLPKVSDELQKCKNPDLALRLLERFGLGNFVESFVINLSNGEQRKLELIRALAEKPDLLVLDNAYTGLDFEDFPASVNRFLVLGNRADSFECSRDEIIHAKNENNATEFRNELPNWKNSDYDELVFLSDVSLQYGDRKILDKINWMIKAGERWSLSGPNGSGKTSLLNLIFADNPKAYGCNIRLFGKQKGTGESIWDIKARIGFVSPEFHQYLPQKQSVIDVICSGFTEAEASFKKPTGYQRDVASRYLKAIGYSGIAGKFFGELSTSAQRVVLLLRTLVKNSPLLILDEPFQGLDAAHVRLLKNLLNRIASESNCAMIFVTHLPEELPECFTLHLKLKEGKVVYQDL